MTVVLRCPSCEAKCRANPADLLVRCPNCAHPLDPKRDTDRKDASA